MKHEIINLQNKLSDLTYNIDKILKLTNYEYDDDLSCLNIDKRNAEELFLWDKLRLILSKLNEINCDIKYLERPIKAQGTAYINNNGRIEINGIELTSGKYIEYLANDEQHCIYENDNEISVPYWKSSRIEHNGNRYYLVSDKNLNIDGLTIRTR